MLALFPNTESLKEGIKISRGVVVNGVCRDKKLKRGKYILQYEIVVNVPSPNGYQSRIETRVVKSLVLIMPDYTNTSSQIVIIVLVSVIIGIALVVGIIFGGRFLIQRWKAKKKNLSETVVFSALSRGRQGSCEYDIAGVREGGRSGGNGRGMTDGSGRERGTETGEDTRRERAQSGNVNEAFENTESFFQQLQQQQHQQKQRKQQQPTSYEPEYLEPISQCEVEYSETDSSSGVYTEIDSPTEYVHFNENDDSRQTGEYDMANDDTPNHDETDYKNLQPFDPEYMRHLKAKHGDSVVVI